MANSFRLFGGYTVWKSKERFHSWFYWADTAAIVCRSNAAKCFPTLRAICMAKDSEMRLNYQFRIQHTICFSFDTVFRYWPLNTFAHNTDEYVYIKEEITPIIIIIIMIMVKIESHEKWTKIMMRYRWLWMIITWL